jgi:ATP-binding cassette subfamily B protein
VAKDRACPRLHERIAVAYTGRTYAALDARAEYEVFQRFSELTKGKTAVLISHRFSTVRMANRILVLEKGELLQMGSHEELLEQGGRYAELFRLQAKGYQ